MNDAAPGWVAKYVGIPFLECGRDRAGVDCWGLLALVMREQFHVAVPSYAERYRSGAELAELATLLEGERPSQPWRRLDASEAVRPGDAVHLRIEGLPVHVGVICAPPWFLHTAQTVGTVVDRLDALRWTRRTLGRYRHADLDR